MPIGALKDISAIRRFLFKPDQSKQHQYEALRAYFIENKPVAQVAVRAFGYTQGSFHFLRHHFRPAPLVE